MLLLKGKTAFRPCGQSQSFSKTGALIKDNDAAGNLAQLTELRELEQPFPCPSRQQRKLTSMSPVPVTTETQLGCPACDSKLLQHDSLNSWPGLERRGQHCRQQLDALQHQYSDCLDTLAAQDGNDAAGGHAMVQGLQADVAGSGHATPASMAAPQHQPASNMHSRTAQPQTVLHEHLQYSLRPLPSWHQQEPDDHQQLALDEGSRESSMRNILADGKEPEPRTIKPRKQNKPCRHQYDGSEGQSNARDCNVEDVHATKDCQQALCSDPGGLQPALHSPDAKARHRLPRIAVPDEGILAQGSMMAVLKTSSCMTAITPSTHWMKLQQVALDPGSCILVNLPSLDKPSGMATPVTLSFKALASQSQCSEAFQQLALPTHHAVMLRPQKISFLGPLHQSPTGGAWGLKTSSSLIAAIMLWPIPGTAQHRPT